MSWVLAKPGHALAGGSRGAAALNERYMWSIVPALAAWPIAFMDAGPGSLAAALLLVSCRPTFRIVRG